MVKKKFVYSFGGGKAEGNGTLREFLGGKGANLAEMAGNRNLRLPVPPGFTITTDVCTHYYDHRRKYPTELQSQVEGAIRKVERLLKRKFGDTKNPLLWSVRSGARVSMPGMMETVLNIGLTSKTIPGMVQQTGGNERFVYDAYRRLIMMYSDVVMEKASGIEPKGGEGIRRVLDEHLESRKRALGAQEDSDLSRDDLKKLCDEFKHVVREILGKPFPDSAEKQLWGAIGAVFASWNGKRAIAYRDIEGIPHEWGTAVNVQSMVFGNMGDDCATGVAFTRDPGNGRKIFYGEYLVNAQGEDVVAGIRTPSPINPESATDQNQGQTTLKAFMPKAYRELNAIQKRLESHYRDMQDIEFTIERGELFMLQCRVGKRNGPAAVKMAVDMVKEKLVTKEQAVTRVTPSQLDELLHPILDPAAERDTTPIAKGLPAGPGGATGQIFFTADDAVREAEGGKQVVLVRDETNPEDVEGMRAAEAILTSRGGMTSHAALVARGWGKCCIVGASSIEVNVERKYMTIDGTKYKEGSWFSLNGSRGTVYHGRLEMVDASQGDKTLGSFLKMCDQIRRLKVRANADTPEDATRARAFGAEGIGLFRTEHMFYGQDSEIPLQLLRKMIFAQETESRRSALAELFPYVKRDVQATLKAMDGYPVTIRLLDPPLHEFVPHDPSKLRALAKEIKISVGEARKRADGLRESNPMMGHRGVRLGITFPEVTEMQVRAIFEATADLLSRGKKVMPEIMIPVVVTSKELEEKCDLVTRVYKETLSAKGLRKIPYLFGTMIEIPRAALAAGDLAKFAQFFSFGTNDLTQMTFGFSRDDTGAFLPEYISRGILPNDPFQTLDQSRVGELVRIGIERGRGARPELKIGICGEHGGDPESVEFCHSVGMDYVSCSPFRVPIARLAAAQAAVKDAGATTKRKTTRSKKAKTAKPGKKKTTSSRTRAKPASRRRVAAKRAAVSRNGAKSTKRKRRATVNR